MVIGNKTAETQELDKYGDTEIGNHQVCISFQLILSKLYT